MAFPISEAEYYQISGLLRAIMSDFVSSDGSRTSPFDPKLLIKRLRVIDESRAGFDPDVPVVLRKLCTVRLGVRRTPEEHLGNLEAKGVQFGRYLLDVAAKIPIAAVEEDMDIFLGAPCDFGIMSDRPLEVIYERAARCGYYPPPAEAGLLIRGAYLNQPESEWFRLAMDPILAPDGFRKVLSFAKNKTGLSLGAYNADLDPGRGHPPGSLWAWCRRKPDANSRD